MDQATAIKEVQKMTSAIRAAITAELSSMIEKNKDACLTGVTPLEVLGTALSHVVGIYAAGVHKGCGINLSSVVASVASCALTAANLLEPAIGEIAVGREVVSAQQRKYPSCGHERKARAVEVYPKCVKSIFH